MPLDFHTLTIADREAYQAVSLRSGRRNCNFTFANLVGWQFWFNTEVCVLADAVVLRFTLDGGRSTTEGSDPRNMRAYMLCMAGTPGCELLRALCEDSGHRLTLLGLEDKAAQQLQQNACREGIDIVVEPSRNQYDYIYRRSDLATMAGGKLKAKRNHINKFRTEHPDFEYRELTPAMFDDCRQLGKSWREERGDVNPEYADTIGAEHRVMETVFTHWDALGMMGGSIWIDGRMVAFTYGSAVTDDTLDVCVEKADRNIDGLFSVICQQFCAHLPEQYTYINREEDMGLEGLRKSKLSYHPEILLTYNAVHFA